MSTAVEVGCYGVRSQLRLRLLLQSPACAHSGTSGYEPKAARRHSTAVASPAASAPLVCPALERRSLLRGQAVEHTEHYQSGLFRVVQLSASLTEEAVLLSMLLAHKLTRCGVQQPPNSNRPVLSSAEHCWTALCTSHPDDLSQSPSLLVQFHIFTLWQPHSLRL